MKYIIYSIFFVFSLLLNACIKLSNSNIKSEYTNISDIHCKTIEQDDETGYLVRTCPGVEGYNLLVITDDGRESINVVTPDLIEYPLNFWNVVTTSFSHIEKTAEWRVLNNKPVALILQVDSFYQEDNKPPIQKSFFSVSKITAKEICVTNVLNNSKTAAQSAREAADFAHTMDCLKP